MKNTLKKLAQIVDQKNILENEDMSKHTSFKAGGKAGALVTVHSAGQLAKALETLNQWGGEYLMLGNGTNTLFTDKGYTGIVLSFGDEFAFIKIVSPEEVAKDFGIKCQEDAVYLEAGGAALLSTVGKFALREGLTGFEFASGIPGSVGGGVFMNAGAYDGELKDILVGVKVVSKDGTRSQNVTADKLDLGYRHSALQGTKDIVLSAVFQLKPGDKEAIKTKMDDLTNRRNTKQPVQFPSCGSFFKRPTGFFAGKLVQDAGFKGAKVGGAQVSDLHSGFIINTGGATATDIIELMRKIQKEVKSKYGVDLEPEVRIIGD